MLPFRPQVYLSAVDQCLLDTSWIPSLSIFGAYELEPDALHWLESNLSEIVLNTAPPSRATLLALFIPSWRLSSSCVSMLSLLQLFQSIAERSNQ